jgi:prolyl 4-hydroxylase
MGVSFKHICILVTVLGLSASLHARPAKQTRAMTQKESERTAQKEPQRVEVLSWSPRIFLIHNFLSEAECDHLIEQSKPQLKRSTVVNDEAVDSGKVHFARTSKGMFFPPVTTDPVIREIEDRIALFTMIPRENGEAIQVLHYEVGGEYLPHHDYFDKTTVGGSASYNRGGQRVASFIMYLHNTEDGGETIFPRASIKVTPKKGNAVLFYDCTLDGKEDPLSLHGGAPVTKGEKWIATKWMRVGTFK